MLVNRALDPLIELAQRDLARPTRGSAVRALDLEPESLFQVLPAPASHLLETVGHVLDANEIGAVAQAQLENQRACRQRVIVGKITGIVGESIIVELPLQAQQRANAGQICVVTYKADKLAVRICAWTPSVELLACYPVRTGQNFTVTSTGSGTGQITNGSDINISR
jgi:hypothetical protein